MKNWRKVFALVLVLAMALTMGVSASADEVADLENGTTPRNETLYFGGISQAKANDINVFSPNSSCMAQDQSDYSYVETYETLYMYNMLDGQIYPLLADGQPEYSEDLKTITVKIKEAAHWSDGTPLTAHDVVATFDSHVKAGSNIGADYGMYMTVEATDDYTVVFTAKEENFNPIKMKAYLPHVYVAQKAYIDSKWAEYGEDNSEAFKTDYWWDAPHSGPYTLVVHNEEKVLFVRDENYWGQDESMWGELPHPKYLCHNTFSGNDTMAVAFQNGEIDVNQQFVANIWTYWEDMGLDVSTYIPEAPYFVDASMPSIWFNCQQDVTNDPDIRRAIANAIDYDQIIASAMSGYSYTFAEVPHSLFNPTDAEQAMYEKCNEIVDLKALNFAGKDYDTANAILDEAGYLDEDGDGYREFNGEKIVLRCECPSGWTDWNGALEIVAACGSEIGLGLETYFPESTVWTEDLQTGNFDIIMTGTGACGYAQPWNRYYNALFGWGGEFPERITNGYSRWYNEEVDTLLAAIPTMGEDEAIEAYARLNEIYLTECPSVALMYRPALFHEVNECVWTGFPEQDDGTNIPPQICIGGYGIASLYEIVNVEG
ncbi:MAG: ABC transporter substrate-binding protein [Clostridia bacterium]|nr:ABC transporter substrate-binding protein [Clostridia bacterium]